MALKPGTWLGHYEVLAHIGSGGMGEVYRARDNKLQREVALKLLPKAFAQDPERVARFRREAQVLAQLNHPNIAAIYSVEQTSVEQTGDTHFLVMELVPGETLRDRIHQSRDPERHIDVVQGAVVPLPAPHSPLPVPPHGHPERSEGPALRSSPLPTPHSPFPAIPLDEALDIAKQIAAGLEAAHEKPIVHRDLKPANVKVTPEGVVKILDFGLARAFSADTGSSDPANSPTLTGMTQPGVILGTAAYMSPEQARGKKVDKRTDIWALGCVLYEMLTGQKAFGHPSRAREQAVNPSRDPERHIDVVQGAGVPDDTIQDILARVLAGEPDWTALPAATPPNVRFVLRRCLEKDPKRRLSSAADLQIQIEESFSAPATETTPAVKSAPPSPLWRRAMPSVLTGVVVAAIAVGITIWNRPAPPSQPVSRFAIQLPPGDRVRVEFSPSVAISPQGSHIVYTGTAEDGQLYLRSLDSQEVKAIPGTEGGINPFFSPDGEWLGFFASGKLMKVAVSGGPPLTLCDAPLVSGATWGPDDTIVFSTNNAGSGPSLFRVPAAGGMPTVLTQPDSSKSEAHGWPEFLPGGNTLLFTSAANNDFDNARIEALHLDSGERRVLIEGGTYPRYAPTGHLVYQRAGTVMAVPFDANRLELTATPAPILEGAMTSLTSSTFPNGSGVAQFGFSRTGSLVYLAGARATESTLVWVDRGGNVEPLGAPPRPYLRPTLSPDGRQIAVNIQGQTSDIWIYDIARGALTRLTFEGNNNGPVWMPDGERIGFSSTRGGPRQLFWRRADGAGSEEQLTNDELAPGLQSISPDGRLAFGTVNATGQADLGFVDLQGERNVEVFLKTPFDEGQAMISPDGSWIAYLSPESGRREVYVRPFPGPGGKWQISTEGGVAPRWARNGRELFYASAPNGQLMAVDVNQSRDSDGAASSAFQAGTPRVVLAGGFRLVSGNEARNYDVSPDGQRFLMVQGGDANLSQLNVVLNWFEELKQRVPVGQ